MGKKPTFSPGMTAGGSINRPGDAISTLKAKNAYNIEFVYIEDIVPNEKNDRYPQIDIESLSTSIESRGLLHNLVVKPMGDARYKLISGERRWRAIGLLRERNPERFTELFPSGLLPCKIQNSENEIDEEIDLIIANHETRNIDVKERLADINQLAVLYRLKEENDHSQSMTALSEKIADQLNISARQIQKYLNLDRLIPELYEAFENNEVSINLAARIAKLGETEQLYLFNILKEDGKLTEEDLEAVKAITEKKKQADKALEDTEKELNVLTTLKEDAKGEKKEIIDKKIEEKKKSSEEVKQTLSRKEMARLRKVAKANKSIETIENSIEKLKDLMKTVGDDAEIKIKIELLGEQIKTLL